MIMAQATNCDEYCEMKNHATAFECNCEQRFYDGIKNFNPVMRKIIIWIHNWKPKA